MASSSNSNSSSSAAVVAAEYCYPNPVPVSDFVKKSLSVSENNYSEWRKQMYNFIKSQDLVGFIDGTKLAPIPVVLPDAGGGGGGGAAAAKQNENQEYCTWKRKDDQVREWIRTTLTQDLCEQIGILTAKEMWTKLEEMFGFVSHYVPLHKAAIEGDWEKAKKFIEQEPDDTAIRASITENSETTLIVAVMSKQRIDFVKKLVKRMSPEDLALGDNGERTALHRAAGAGNIEAAKLLVTKNPYLPNAQTSKKRIPLYFAASRGYREMVLYLLSVTIDEAKPKNTPHLFNANLFSQNQRLTEGDGNTRMGIKDDSWNPKPFEGEPGFKILHELTISGFYDIALALLKYKPELASFIPKKKEDLEYHSLMAIAQRPSSFHSGFSSFNFFKNFIYLYIPVKLENNDDHQGRRDIENPVDNHTKKRLHAMFWKVIENFVPCIKHIREKKLVHQQAVELVKFLCNQIAKENYTKATEIFNRPLVQATSTGIHEIVEEILRSYPTCISLQNEEKQSIFEQSIVCRREKVFNLIQQVGESRTTFLSQVDELGNNALHLAGKLAPQQQLYRTAGPALQMQRELQWFKEVEKLMMPHNKEKRNKDGKTPAEVFTEEHREMIKDGVQWLKDTANSSTIVAALIVTVVFAAAITVPGGNNSDGDPIFYNRTPFLIFGISDAFALFSSVTSVLLFLSILTSRYGEDDFLVIIPRRLVFGLITLFLSILSTMIAFGATLHLVFRDSYKGWILIPVVVLPTIPVALFVFLQFPLLVDMFKSTYCTIFVKQSNHILY